MIAVVVEPDANPPDQPIASADTSAVQASHSRGAAGGRRSVACRFEDGLLGRECQEMGRIGRSEGGSSDRPGRNGGMAGGFGRPSPPTGEAEGWWPSQPK
jgi:hypothetical protein